MSNSQLGAIQLFCIGFGLVIGVGWVFMPGIWIADAAWVGAIIAFVIGGLCTGYLALIYQEISPENGRRYNEIEIANSLTGPLTALLMGAGLFLFYLSGLIFEALAIIWLIDSFYPSTWLVLTEKTGVVFNTGFAYIGLLLLTSTVILGFNLKGLKTSSLWQVMLVTALGSGIVLSLLLAITLGNVGNLGLEKAVGDPIEVLEGIGVLVPTVFLWFVGFNVVLDAGRASRLSKTQVAKVTLLVVFAGGCVHLISLVIGGLLAPRETYLMADAAPGLLLAFDKIPYGPVLKSYIFVAAMAGLFSTANGFFVAVYRLIEEMIERFGQSDFAPLADQAENKTYRPLLVSYALWLIVGLAVVVGPDIETTIRIILDAASISIIAVYLGIVLIWIYNRLSKPLDTHSYVAPFFAVAAPTVGGLLITALTVLVFLSEAPTVGPLRLDLLLFAVATLGSVILYRMHMKLHLKK